MKPKNLINFIFFQTTWFVCVLGATYQLPWLGLIFASAASCWHLYIANNRLAEFKLLICVLLIGGLFDQLLLSNHLVSYQAHGWSEHLVPVWILGLWIGFATTLNVSFRWMHSLWLIPILFGLIGGPLAYFSAVKLGAITLNSIPQAYIALAIGWGVLTPTFIQLAKHHDGYKTIEIKS